jgi:hypothetical protein
VLRTWCPDRDDDDCLMIARHVSNVRKEQDNRVLRHKMLPGAGLGEAFGAQSVGEMTSSRSSARNGLETCSCAPDINVQHSGAILTALGKRVLLCQSFLPSSICCVANISRRSWEK